MAGNPNPQSNPTNGIGVAAFVQLSGTGITANETTAANKPNPGNYTLTLSLTSAGGHQLYCTATASLVDVSDNTSTYSVYDPQQNFVAESYNDPAAGSPTWYKPSAVSGYSASVASAVASGTNGSTITITALAVGTAVVEVSFPTFDNTIGASQPGQPINMVYTQVVVTVVP